MLKQKKDFLFGIVFGLHYFGFAEDRLRLGIKNKKKDFLFCSPLGLHYLCGHELKPLINLLFCHWLSAYSESAKS